jgi:hypothetical protein
MNRGIIWALIVFAAFVGACGNILWKVASNQIEKVPWQKLLDLKWDLRTLFTPIVFVALFLIFVGRFVSVVPTGYMGITQLVTPLTVTSLIFTVLMDTFLLKTRYPLNVWIGITLGIIAVYLISKNVAT